MQQLNFSHEKGNMRLLTFPELVQIHCVFHKQREV